MKNLSHLPDIVKCRPRIWELTRFNPLNRMKICQSKIQEYIEKRGLKIWDYRLLDKDPISDSLYFKVMKEGKQRCALCGATRDKRMLHVDHIIPRSIGGNTEYENLQVLCIKCNLAKKK